MANGRHKRKRSDVVCAYCGAKYERFRSPSVPSFADAAAIMLAMAKAFVEDLQDYSKPSRRTCILGYMHGVKKTAWKDEHLYWCALEHATESYVAQESDDAPF